MNKSVPNELRRHIVFLPGSVPRGQSLLCVPSATNRESHGNNQPEETSFDRPFEGIVTFPDRQQAAEFEGHDVES
jgi:hypothetical protein